MSHPLARTRDLELAGKRVDRIAFGAMRIVGQPGNFGEPSDRAAAIRVLRQAAADGVTLIDTADSYGPGVSEELIAEALHPYPADLLVATKGGRVKTAPGTAHSNASPAHLRAACEASLRRLRLDRIDLYQLHFVDPETPFERSVEELARLRHEGKIAHIGLSNVDETQLRSALAIAPIVSVQNRYNLRDRSWDDLIDLCADSGIAFLAYAPLDARPFEHGARLTDQDTALAAVARRHGVSVARVALAWILARSPVTVPIVGTTTSSHLRDDLAALDLILTDDDLRDLN